MCGATTTLLYGANLVLDPVSEDATPDPESDVKGMVKVAAPYHVRVMVPTYSEPLDIVAKTCAAAATAWLPRGCRVTVYLCDDGKDRKKRNWCFKGDGRAHGVVYVSGRTRASGEMNGKSANLNNCMRHLYPDGKPVPPNEIVAVFDADQVANPDFFLKTLYKLDAGDDVAMVLSPQAFYNTRLNADIFNHSNIHFWEYAQHGYDALGFISCTGTNFLCRAAAYKDAGWSPEYTLTEDFALGMELKKKKWECRCVGRASEGGREGGGRVRAATPDAHLPTLSPFSQLRGRVPGRGRGPRAGAQLFPAAVPLVQGPLSNRVWPAQPAPPKGALLAHAHHVLLRRLVLLCRGDDDAPLHAHPAAHHLGRHVSDCRLQVGGRRAHALHGGADHGHQLHAQAQVRDGRGGREGG